MTSDPLALGEADLETRWLGLTPERALAASFGLAWGALCVAGVLAPVAWTGVVVAGLVTLPGPERRSVGQWAAIGLGFLLRRRVREIAPEAPVRWRLAHRGRLDLTGEDRRRAQQLAAHLDALAHGGGAVLWWWTRPGPAGGTWLVGEAGAGLSGYEPDDAAPVIGAGPLLERWDHLRGPGGTVAVLRVRDLSAVPPGRAGLASLQRVDEEVEVVVRYEVHGARRAPRRSARAVHRARSDAAAARVAGLRHSARAQRTLARLERRETEVAAGRALVDLGLYVVVRAHGLRELDERVEDLVATATRSGLGLERGRGRQVPWLRALPGVGTWG